MAKTRKTETMEIYDFFDPTNREHMTAYSHFKKRGVWKGAFLSKQKLYGLEITFNNPKWEQLIDNRIKESNVSNISTKEPVAVKDDAKVIITMSIDQAYYVINALELHARLHIGQFDHLDWEFVSHGKERNFWRDQEPRDRLRWHLQEARDIIFPELKRLGSGASHGIFNQTEIGETAHVAWDMYQCVRYQLAYYRNPTPDPVHEWSVSFNRPMKSSEIHEMPTVEIVKDGKNVSKPVTFL